MNNLTNRHLASASTLSSGVGEMVKRFKSSAGTGVVAGLAAAVTLALVPADVSVARGVVEPILSDAVGLDAIGGTGRAKRGADAIGGTGIDAISNGGMNSQLLLQGPVESVSTSKGTVTVFGRPLKLGVTRSVTELVADSLAAGNAIVLAVTGRQDARGKATGMRAYVLEDQYVPGVSQVVLTGAIGSLDWSRGIATIGRQVIDLNALPAASTDRLTVGQPVVLLGTQPTLRGTILASKLIPID